MEGRFVPLNNSEIGSVYFVGHRMNDSVKIGGTALLIALPVPGRPDERFMYFVTAGHVIDHAPSAVVRVPRFNGGVVDLDVRDWIMHPQYDVAAAPVVLSESEDRQARLTYMEPDIFVDNESWSHQFPWLRPFDVHFGDTVHLIGLFPKLPDAARELIPLVRTGNVAQLWQENLPVRDYHGRERAITAHMIDCRVFGGMSGAPCFVEQDRAFVKTGVNGITVGTSYRNGLLGIVGGHFDDWKATRDESGEPSPLVSSVVNTGIAYVIPIEHVRSVFELDEIVDQQASGTHRMQAVVTAESPE